MKKEEKYKVDYCGLVEYEGCELSAEFVISPHIQNNGVTATKGMFWAIVSLNVLGIEEIDEEGLTNQQIEKAKEAIISEL
ncbi:MAG: hypothetical protein ACP5FQ_07700 [Thermoplasmata archaeon]